MIELMAAFTKMDLANRAINWLADFANQMILAGIIGALIGIILVIIAVHTGKKRARAAAILEEQRRQEEAQRHQEELAAQAAQTAEIAALREELQQLRKTND